ncbi:MAG: GIY-YIG nuclease family protein, partial [Candidatus Daviesbacteria bacterium]|nr:GIY-YIG nuclease family protein [Candidatus Daviesbacteria bacterium]
MLNSKINPRKVPHKPGVYLFKDKAGQVIYIGKAIDLKSRVSSYFSSVHLRGVRTKKLVDNIYAVETIIVESELEALILEANLIKKYLPKFN